MVTFDNTVLVKIIRRLYLFNLPEILLSVLFPSGYWYYVVSLRRISLCFLETKANSQCHKYHKSIFELNH